MSTIRALLSNTVLPAAEARTLLAYLLAHYFQLPKSALISRDEMSLSSDFLASWQALEKRRINGEPIAYLIGTRPFHQIELMVNAAVLIPRPETELLVDLALQEMAQQRQQNPASQLRILDLGTGSGAIALAIASAFEDLPGTANPPQFMATDVSAEALNVAMLNAAQLKEGQNIEFILSDWYQALPQSQCTATFDLILSNPPYIHAGDDHLQQGDLRYEPITALSDGQDGLSCLRAIITGAPLFLRPQGLIAVEHGYDQLNSVLEMMAQAGLQKVRSYTDLAGIPRVVSARKAL
jgi:release factor glutamine methyltransferase